ncbi:hypothetical protein MSIBF_A2260004 [groundwater metagenome]|uniref:Uncharacterized protein n=1 Tax=groundwater metagenome TaxID=717931 RepID=A0A098E8Q3_9ZZZZ
MLREYKKSPDEKQKEFLERKFDEMFSTKTEYDELARRIELTKKQKEGSDKDVMIFCNNFMYFNISRY